MELMSPDVMAVGQVAGFFILFRGFTGFPVFQLNISEADQAVRHAAGAGQDPAHGKGLCIFQVVRQAFQQQFFLQVHEAAALREDRHALRGARPDGFLHGRIARERLRVQLRIAAAQQQSLRLRQGFVMDRGEKDQVCAALPQQLQVVLVIEVKSLVPGDRDAGRRSLHRAFFPGHTGAGARVFFSGLPRVRTGIRLRASALLRSFRVSLTAFCGYD